MVEEGWISIDRLKIGPANHKAFLTPERKKIVKAWKRDLPDARDEFIREKGHLHLGVGYNQVKFKTPNHGSAHGLPVNEKGRTSKTEKNALNDQTN